MLNFLTEFAPWLTLLCPVGIGPVCLLLIVSKWFARRSESVEDRTFLNWRLGVSLVVWLPLTGFMCLLSLFYVMADSFDDAPRAVSFGELAPWLSIPVVYVCVGAGLVYLMWAPVNRPLR